jgi:putative nucleotidyltransferase with HDIG domain
LLLLIKKGAEFRASALASHRITQGLREHNAALEKQNILLAQRIEESTKNLTRLYEDLRSTYMRTIKVLAQAIDARDHYTHSHSEDVAKYAVVIATELGFSSKDIETFRQACELHDLGKIGIEDKILSKESELTAEEWIQIRRHPIIAVQILEPLTFLHDVIDLIRQHHEHYDGSGYPEGRRGEDILLGARIIHLADAYESMRSARSYRKIPLTKEEAILEIKINSGKQFDPNVVKAFLKIVDKL